MGCCSLINGPVPSSTFIMSYLWCKEILHCPSVWLFPLYRLYTHYWILYVLSQANYSNKYFHFLNLPVDTSMVKSRFRYKITKHKYKNTSRISHCIVLESERSHLWHCLWRVRSLEICTPSLSTERGTKIQTGSLPNRRKMKAGCSDPNDSNLLLDIWCFNKQNVH